jgi:ATP-dependent RNA helicase DeaD
MYAIIFVRTKIDARDISKKLQKDGIECDALHGDLSQTQRDDVMERFRAKRLKVLVATDVAARGLDVDNLTHVINYNLPEDVESYTHRSGRTGRAGKEGTSVAIIHSKEKGKLRRIEKIIHKKFQYQEVPGGEEVCRAQLLFYADKIMASEPKETMNRYEQDLYEKFELLSKEELIQKIISYEFGKLLKKYANVEDLNLPAHERGEKSGREDRVKEEEFEYTTFSVNIGREDGLTPRDLMAIINQNAPRKGIQIGSIKIFETTTKFEVDIRGIKGFKASFRYVYFNGLPFTLSEVKDRYNRNKGDERDRKRTDERKRGEERERRRGDDRRRNDERRKGDNRGRELSGKRKKSDNNRWQSEKRRSDGGGRERFGDKKKRGSF